MQGPQFLGSLLPSLTHATEDWKECLESSHRDGSGHLWGCVVSHGGVVTHWKGVTHEGGVTHGGEVIESLTLGLPCTWGCWKGFGRVTLDHAAPVFLGDAV